MNHFPKVFLLGKATYRPVGSLCYNLLYLALWFYSETLVPVTRSVESLAAGAALSQQSGHLMCQARSGDSGSVGVGREEQSEHEATEIKTKGCIHTYLGLAEAQI